MQNNSAPSMASGENVSNLNCTHALRAWRLNMSNSFLEMPRLLTDRTDRTVMHLSWSSMSCTDLSANPLDLDSPGLLSSSTAAGGGLPDPPEDAEGPCGAPPNPSSSVSSPPSMTKNNSARSHQTSSKCKCT